MKKWSDENEKLVGFFARRVPQFFSCGGLFFIEGALKTVKKSLKPLKTVKFSKNRQIFEKKDFKILSIT